MTIKQVPHPHKHKWVNEILSYATDPENGDALMGSVECEHCGEYSAQIFRLTNPYVPEPHVCKNCYWL